MEKWETVCLALAEKFDAETRADGTPTNPPPKQPLTPEEWQARIDRYRQRKLSKKRVKVEDDKAEIMQDLALLQEFADDLDNYPLDEDEKEQLIQEFKERLLGGEEESGGGFKQV